MSTNHVRTVAVVLLVVAVGSVVAPVASTAAPDTHAQQSSPTACDFAALYDETIDSVVSVRTDAGLGSGFVYSSPDENGSVVVTNAHVVGEAAEVTVEFTAGQTREGTVVGRDRLTDLAAVRVPEMPGDVQPLSLVEDRPEHGQVVAALGNPFGLEETITHGIVSGLNRSMPTQLGFSIPNTIQTDAPISPGNSGGPLVTCDGEVVGVNTAGIAARGAENIGFAISSTVVQRVVPSLVETGEFEHPYLGVRVSPVTTAVAEANDLAEPQGVQVVSIQPGVPAGDVLQGADRVEEVGGRQVPVGGDVIVAVDNRTIQSPEDLSSVLLTRTRPGEEVTLTVIRDGERTNVTTTVTERPDPGSA